MGGSKDGACTEYRRHPNSIARSTAFPVASWRCRRQRTILLMTLIASFIGANEGDRSFRRRYESPAHAVSRDRHHRRSSPLSAFKLFLQVWPRSAPWRSACWHVTGISSSTRSYRFRGSCSGQCLQRDGRLRRTGGRLAVIMLVFAGARAGEAWVPLVTIGALLGFLSSTGRRFHLSR
jgi:hypothetical protein